MGTRPIPSSRVGSLAREQNIGGALPHPPRVVVVGKSGSGKTTLARDLASLLQVPHFELDALHWEPGWREADTGTFRERCSQALAAPSWVCDGNYGKSRDIVWSRANAVLWLDFPLTVVLWRLVSRTARRIRHRTELWNGNRESLRSQFAWDNLFIWAIKNHRKHRRDYPQVLSSPEFEHLSVIRLRNPRELETWWKDIVENAG